MDRGWESRNLAASIPAALSESAFLAINLGKFAQLTGVKRL